MNINDLRAYSQNIKSQANSIIESTKLIFTLKEFGEVLVHGSYPLDVMFDPDIDIIVTTTGIRNASVNALKKLIDLSQFQKFEYGDFVKYPREKRPNGYIIVLKTTVKNVKWEVEIWFLESSKKEQENFEWLSRRINNDARDKILEAKHLRHETGKSKHQSSSHELYKQILN